MISFLSFMLTKKSIYWSMKKTLVRQPWLQQALLSRQDALKQKKNNSKNKNNCWCRCLLKQQAIHNNKKQLFIFCTVATEQARTSYWRRRSLVCRPPHQLATTSNWSPISWFCLSPLFHLVAVIAIAIKCKKISNYREQEKKKVFLLQKKYITRNVPLGLSLE